MDWQTPKEVRALFDAAGGPTELARRMGFDKRTGRARTANWRMNGRIPEMVIKAYRPLFKRIMARAAAAKDSA